VPPSLRNILAETGLAGKPPHGNLEAWARRGVLLLNAVLTVERGAPQSHAKRGWENFTAAVLKRVVARCTAAGGGAVVVFLLWGKPAQEAAAKAGVRDGVGGMRVLSNAHPSPLSAYRGFVGSAFAARANDLLVAAGQPKVSWALE